MHSTTAAAPPQAAELSGLGTVLRKAATLGCAAPVALNVVACGPGPAPDPAAQLAQMEAVRVEQVIAQKQAELDMKETTIQLAGGKVCYVTVNPDYTPRDILPEAAAMVKPRLEEAHLRAVDCAEVAVARQGVIDQYQAGIDRRIDAGQLDAADLEAVRDLEVAKMDARTFQDKAAATEEVAHLNEVNRTEFLGRLGNWRTCQADKSACLINSLSAPRG